MPRGGRLAIEVTPATITAESELAFFAQRPEPGTYVRLAVTDTGPGIEDDILERIFEPFFSRKGPNGIGLGLSSVYGIVRQHGGCIGVRNVEPHGARFEILLPASAPLSKPRMPSLPPAAAMPERVLLVEDDDAVRRVVRTALESRGHVVLEARDAADAQRVLRGQSQQPNVLVSDVVMPGLHGPELFETLRRELPLLRAVFISGHASERLDLTLGAGVAYLDKPFSLRDLHDALDRTR